jgi:hypothetical protein
MAAKNSRSCSSMPFIDTSTFDVDLLVLAVEQVVVARDVGAGVADVAEEGAQRPVVVEAEAQRADRAVGRLELDAHVHRDAQRRVDRALHGIGRTIGLRPDSEQVHRVRGVVPQQVVGPAARLAQRVHVACGGRSRSARPSAGC